MARRRPVVDGGAGRSPLLRARARERGEHGRLPRRRERRLVYPEGSVMTDFVEVERAEIAVQFIRVPDGLEEIGRAWNELESVVALRGRHFYGAYDPVADDYRACVEVRDGDELVPGLESGTLPGGRFLRARLRCEPPALYERINPTFDEMVRQAKQDETRPS